MNNTKKNFEGRVKTSKMDNYDTPIKAWEDIMNLGIPKNIKLWLPFYNTGNAKKYLENMEYENIIHKNKDFFTYKEEDAIVIDNPPYSIKEKVIEKLFNSGISFSLLLPLDTMERKYFKKYDINFQLIIPAIRYNFSGSKKNNVPFKTCWFCWNMKEYIGNEKIIFLKE